LHTITLVTQKGGSGKSTLAINLAVTCGRGRKRSLLIDLDPQATSAKWYERRCRHEISDQPGVVAVEASQLPEALRRAKAANIDTVFIDTAGRDDPSSAAAIKHADFCLVACRPTPADIEALEPTIGGLLRQRKPFAFVITQAPAVGFRIKEAETGLELQGLVAPIPVVTRVAYQDALGNGQGVIEYDRDGKAARETIALTHWLNRELRKLNG